MEKRRPAAERIRPILEAMERSLDRARRQRTGESANAGKPSASGESPNAIGNNDAHKATPPQQRSAELTQSKIERPPDVPRSPDGTPLRARPKRPQNAFTPPLAAPYRSQAS